MIRESIDSTAQAGRHRFDFSDKYNTLFEKCEFSGIEKVICGGQTLFTECILGRMKELDRRNTHPIVDLFGGKRASSNRPSPKATMRLILRGRCHQNHASDNL